jgi:hypothetical protein
MPPPTNYVQILQDPTQIFRSRLSNQSNNRGKSSNEKAIWNPQRGFGRASRSGNTTTSAYVSPTIPPIPIPATIQSTQIQDQAVPTQAPQTATQPQAQPIVEIEDEEMGGTLPQNNAHTHKIYA